MRNKETQPKRTKPTVSKENGLTVVRHPDGTIVRSHKTPEDYGTVKLYDPSTGNSRVAKVVEEKQFHGDPCERASFKAGGHGYDKE